jgi:hypothetical protein
MTAVKKLIGEIWDFLSHGTGKLILGAFIVEILVLILILAFSAQVGYL